MILMLSFPGLVVVVFRLLVMFIDILLKLCRNIYIQNLFAKEKGFETLSMQEWITTDF